MFDYFVSSSDCNFGYGYCYIKADSEKSALEQVMNDFKLDGKIISKRKCTDIRIKNLDIKNVIHTVINDKDVYYFVIL